MSNDKSSGTVDESNAALQRLLESLPLKFTPDYIKNAIVPAYLMGIYDAGSLPLPMISVSLSKQNALPYYLWGCLYDNWEPPTTSSAEEGTTLFLTGLENRGDDNLRKRIYFSALTPDLYEPMYRDKVTMYFNRLLAPHNAGKPFIQLYLDTFFDLYWDLHVGVTGDAIPPEVRQIGTSFNTVLSYEDPREEIVYDNYMIVRELRSQLNDWINDRVNDVLDGETPNPEKTFVYYWLQNAAGNEQYFSQQDITFECFHNFVALSQWAHTLYGIISYLGEDGNTEVRSSFAKIMSGEFDQAGNTPYTPLNRFVMELFRLYSPNAASISTLTSPKKLDKIEAAQHNYISVPHKETSVDPSHWTNPEQFDPDRYLTVPTSAQINEEKIKEMGFAQCPFKITTFKVEDGRDVGLTNSGFGTVYGAVDSKPMPVCDYAGFAPFGFGYRRCPGEQLTQKVFEDFLRKMWTDKIEFVNLQLPNPKEVPAGPGTVVPDKYGFTIRV